MESTLATKITTTTFFYILEYFYQFFNYICNFFFSQFIFFVVPKKLLYILKIKLKNQSWHLVEKQKSDSKLKKCPKNAQKLKIFSLKIHKSAGIFKNL